MLEESEVQLLHRATYGTDQADAVVASMFHLALAESLRGATTRRTVETWNGFQTRLHQPRVQWETRDEVFSVDVPDDGLEYGFVFPDNADLDSTSQVAVMARDLVGPESIDLPASSGLGDAHEHGRIGDHSVYRLICSEDGEVSDHALCRCLSDAGGQQTFGRFGCRYIVPVVGAKEQNVLDPGSIADWADAWSTSIRCAPVSVLFRFQQDDESRARDLERSLLALGVPCCRAEAALGEGGGISYLESLRVRSSSQRMNAVPLDIVDRWIKSEIRQPAERWGIIEELASSVDS